MAKLFNCRSVMMRQGGKVQFVGKPSNVLIAADTLQWVVEQVGDLHKQALKAFRLDQLARNGEATKDLRERKFESRDFRLTFKEACALRIWQRVNEIVAAARNEIPAHMALVVIDQALAAADDILKTDGVTAGRSLIMRRSGFGTGAGRAAGNQVKLQRESK